MFEQLIHPWWTLILLGLGAGVLSGMLGIGSGVVMVPALVILYSLPQKSAQGMALMVMIPLAMVGALRYWRNPSIEVDFTIAALVAAGAVVGTLIGTEIAIRVPAHWLRRAFSVFLVVVAVKMFLTAPKKTKAAPPENGPDPAAQTMPAEE